MSIVYARQRTKVDRNSGSDQNIHRIFVDMHVSYAKLLYYLKSKPAMSVFVFQVVRQHEQVLSTAVNKLCNGFPSKETVEFLRGLQQQPLDVPIEDVTRLFGTNFDAQYINHVTLEAMEGDVVVYKSKDDGK